MRVALLKAAVIAAWIMIAMELVVFALGLASIAVGETTIGGGASGYLVTFFGMVRTVLHGLVLPAILLVAIEMYRTRTL